MYTLGMHMTPDGKIKRTDIWREGKWLDLWSVVHILSGISMAFILFQFHFGAPASIVLAFLLLVSYEMWEAMVKIEETPTNRFMDVVVGMVSFLPVFFLFVPQLSLQQSIVIFGFVFISNVLMSVFGWHASQKAATLEQHMRARYAKRRTRILKRKERLSEKFQ